MRSKRTSSLRSRLTWACLIFLSTLYVTSGRAQGFDDATPRTVSLAQLDGALSLADGKITIDPSAGPAPVSLGNFQQYGTLVSHSLAVTQPTDRLQLTYTAVVPPGSASIVDVRGSPDGKHWLPWLTNLPSGAVVSFGQPVRQAQYRVALAGGLGAAPTVRNLSLATTSRTATVSAAAPNPYAVAPTFRVRATRMGMVGGRTANGYIIPPHAHFASLPSRSVLSTRGSNEYQVRITYGGRSTVVPVYDVGPYSARDDYWDTKRDGYPDLERGWPMDHAAFYEGYNGRHADKGYVYFPTAVDVGDGAWIDDLGIDGDQAEVEVTYLWMGQDPFSGPPTRDPGASEQIVDELGGDFSQNVAFGASAMGCGNGRHAYRATVNSNPTAAPSARWQPKLPVEGSYDLYVYVPVCPSKRAPTTEAHYLVQHRDGVNEVVINQKAQTGWVKLGRFSFAAGTNGYIELDGFGPTSATVWFDQAKWVRVP